VRNPQHDDQWVVFKCDQFSIGWGPSVIWALGNRRWYEIQPSVEYEATYAKMAEGIAFYYHFTVMYEQMAKKLAAFAIDAVLKLVSFSIYYWRLPHANVSQLAEIEGNNTTTVLVREKIKRHASFILTEMVKKPGTVHWIRTKLCNWLIAECPVSRKNVLKYLLH
jgi:hypothetical protein